MLERYDCAVFDFDGVVLDSNAAKTEAFRKTLADDPPELVDRLIDYHQYHGGVSRFVKFEHYYRNIRGGVDIASSMSRALDRFSAFSLRALMECDEIPGVRRILDRLVETNIPCFVVSGGAQDEVRKVVAARGLERYFHRVLGSPATKLENMAKLAAEGLLGSPGVYFGDARSDMDAATTFNLNFVFVAGRSEWRDGAAVCAHEGFSVIGDFGDLS